MNWVCLTSSHFNKAITHYFLIVLCSNNSSDKISFFVENDFRMDNTMISSFGLMSLEPLNLTNMENEEFLYDYWVNTLAV